MSINNRFKVNDESKILTPGLIIYPKRIEHKFKMADWPDIMEIKRKKTIDNMLKPMAKPSILSIKLKAFVIATIQKIVNEIFSQKSNFESVW